MMSTYNKFGAPTRPMRSAWALVLAVIFALLASLLIPASGAAAALAKHPDPVHAVEPTADLVATPQDSDLGKNIAITEFSPALVTPGDQIRLKATITNHGAEPIVNPKVSFNVMRYRFTSRTALARWQDQDLGSNAGTVIASNSLGDELASGASITTEFTVDSAQLQLLGGTAGWGPRGTAVILSGENAEGTMSRVDVRYTYLLWDSAPEGTDPMLTLSTVAPLSGPVVNPMEPEAVSERVIAATAEQSRLANVVAALKSIPSLNLAVDPNLIEGVQQAIAPPQVDPAAPAENEEDAGTAEPTIEQRVTKKWLDAASKLITDHESYLLPNYDADLGALTQAGITTPTPTARDLGDIPATLWRTNLVWPEPDSLTQEFLSTHNATGSIIITEPGAATPQQNLTYTPGALTPNPAQTHSTVVVGDEILTSLLTDPGTDSPVLARQRFVSELAVIAKERPSVLRNIVVTLPRDWNPDPKVATAQLASLDKLPWLSNLSLSDLNVLENESSQTFDFALDATGTQGLTNELVTEATTAAKDLNLFAAVVPEPQLLTESVDQAARAILSTAWRKDPAGRDLVVSQISEYTRDTMGALSVDTGSDINLISTGSEIPLTARNALDQDATVLIQLQPNNPRLQVKETIAVTIPAGGSQQVRVPVTAVGSGNVEVAVRILTADAELAAESGSFTVRVRADWENLGTSVVVGLLVIILGAGIVRTIRRGKSKRRTEPKDAAASLKAVQAPASVQNQERPKGEQD